MTRRSRPIALGIAGVLLLGVAWELYKALAPDTGVIIGDVTVLPRTTDIAMPHIWDMIGRALEPVTSAASSPRHRRPRSASEWPRSAGSSGSPSGSRSPC